MKVQYGGISSPNLARMVQYNDLGIEGFTSLGRIILGITTNIPPTNFLHRNVLDVEPDVITGKTLHKSLMVHFDGFDFSSHVRWREGDYHTSLDDSSLDTSHGYCANAADFVHILKGKTERFVG